MYLPLMLSQGVQEVPILLKEPLGFILRIDTDAWIFNQTVQADVA
jgi:hypothetical protein